MLNNNRITYVLYVIVLFMGVNCKDSTSSIVHETDILINIDNQTILPDYKLSSLIKDFEIIPLEETSHSLLGNVTQIEIFGEYLYVLDTYTAKALFVFDFEGNFIRKIGAEGRGPGEYIQPKKFTIDYRDGTVYILDSRANKIVKYQNNGQFLKEITIEQNIIDFAYNSKGLVLFKWPYNEIDIPLISIINDNGDIETELMPGSDYNQGYLGPIIPSKIIVRNNDFLGFLSKYDNTIYCVNDSVVTRYISIESKNMLTNDDISKIKNWEREVSIHPENPIIAYDHQIVEFPDKLWGIDNYIETDRLSFIQYSHPIQLTVIIDHEKSTSIICNKLIDDITEMDFIQFNDGGGKYIMTFINAKSHELLIQNIIDGVIPIEKNKRKRIMNFENGGNPIIILYSIL